ncbi:MAG: nucleoside deaminase [Acidobacteria bacterium]|nr:nucleoside deaminase [Acidobacteriota bacterium]
MWTDDEFRFMGLALGEAEAAERSGEVPIGAVIVKEGLVIGMGRNAPIGTCDATAHAEIQALREAGLAGGNYRLSGATLYVTLEPCLMCFGAMLHARIARVVFAAPDPKVGVSKLLPALEGAHLNHRLDLIGGLREAEARAQLKRFFAERR